MSTESLPEIIAHEETDLDPGWKVLVHNDDVTPFDFVTVVLRSIFQLSPEIAEHVTLTAHFRGIALVVVLPKTEAEKRVAKAHMAARLEGYPLTFSMEPDE